MSYDISFSCINHIGSVRSINQDNFICNGHYFEKSDKLNAFLLTGIVSSKESSLFGVFDGMGGEERGEVAAYIAAKDAAALNLSNDPIGDLLGFCDFANRDICSYMIENEVLSMGTTAAMLAFTPKSITLCNIGDSKIFHLCDGYLRQISQDHLAAAPFGRKPPLSQNLGIPPETMILSPYVAQGIYRDGDIYLICSDGLTDMVEKEDITNALALEGERAAKKLLEQAIANGGWDNITLIICKVMRHGWFWKGRRKGPRFC